MNRVFGIGTDIVQVSRIKKIVDRYGHAFAARILSAEEYPYYAKLSSHQVSSYLAKRFAAKEAVAKALGIGFSKGMAFNQISITNHKEGKPRVTYSGQAQRYILHYCIEKTLISLSDEKEFAIAFVTLLQTI